LSLATSMLAPICAKRRCADEEFDALIGIPEMLKRLVGKPAYETRPVMNKTEDTAAAA
jgi:hypothetical protein